MSVTTLYLQIQVGGLVENVSLCIQKEWDRNQSPRLTIGTRKVRRALNSHNCMNAAVQLNGVELKRL